MLKAIKRLFAHPNEDQAPKLEPRTCTGKHADGELATQAVACKRWQWRPGMAAIASPQSQNRIRVAVGVDVPDGWLPDLDDPATVGCLIAIVREAWGCRDDRVICLECDVSDAKIGPRWSVTAKQHRDGDPWDAVETSDWFRCKRSRAKRAPDVEVWKFGSPRGAWLAFYDEVQALVFLLEAAP